MITYRIMKNKKEILKEIADLKQEFYLLKEDEEKGWANYQPEKDILTARIQQLEWVLDLQG